MTENPCKVLFICTGNSARSQIAEALLRHLGAEQFVVASAGTQPKPIHPKALGALQKVGIATHDLASKPLECFAEQSFDVVITLCDKASQECQHLPNTKEVLAWNFEDPSHSDDPFAFERTLMAIQERIKLFVLVKTRKQ